MFSEHMALGKRRICVGEVKQLDPFAFIIVRQVKYMRVIQ